MNKDRPAYDGIGSDRCGTCPWCGKQGRPLYKTTALLPLKCGDEDMTVVSEYVCASCMSDAKAERYWLKRVRRLQDD